MKNDQNNRMIKRLDWGRLIIALIGLLAAVYTFINPGVIDSDYILSNIVALYVLLMGIKTYLIGKNISLAKFYMFFSAIMLVAVNMIQIKFG